MFETNRPMVHAAGNLLLALLVLTSAAGCQDENASGRYVLSGMVSYDGQPIPDGTIELFPSDVNKKPAGAEIVDGRYEMERTLGPELGLYQVVILANRPSGRKAPADEGSSEMIDVPEQYIPPAYNTRTTLKVEVTGDQENVDFVLEKPKRRRSR